VTKTISDWKIGSILTAIYLLLFGSVVAHIIFNLEVEYVTIFIWNVDRITMLTLTLILLGIAFLIQLYLAIDNISGIRKKGISILVLGISILLIILGMALLQYSLQNEIDNRLVVFDMAILIIVIAWSVNFWVSIKNWRQRR
jgi:hypothetical protein